MNTLRFIQRLYATIAIFVMLIAAGQQTLIAQTVSATLVGTVTDKTGSVLPNAHVLATNADTNTTRDTTTNGSGNYSLPDLPPGSYSVTIEAPGFRKEVRASVDVIVNTTTRIDFDLTPGSTSETITVTDTAPILQTDRADVTTKIEAEKLENLPVGTNRNFQGLLNLVPGTTPASFQHSQFFNAQSSLQTEANGLPRMGNVYQIEGIDDNERTGLLQVIIPPADSIQTVDASTNNYEAELGRAVGAVVNVTLKSGTNRFHGSASEYLQNSYFNAKSYFQAYVPHLAYNYFGGNLSGPIFKDKFFFYGDYFRTSDHEAVGQTVTVPFKKSTTCTNGFYDLSDGYTANGKGQIYDPATGVQTGAQTGYNRTAFAGNRIPCNRVNPVSAALLAAVPAPNQNLSTTGAPNNNYFAALPFTKESDNYDAKLDYQMSTRDRLSGRYSFQRSNVFQAPIFGSFAGGPSPNGGFAGRGIQNAWSTGINYTHTFTPTLLTEARVGVAHYRNDAQPSDYGVNDATTVGVPGVNLDQMTSGQVGINLGSFSQPTLGYAASMPWVRAEANIDFVNHWTKVSGNHQYKFGVDLRRIRDDLLQGQTFSPRGLYTFGQNQTGFNCAGVAGCVQPATGFQNDIASFLLDLPSAAGRDLFTYFPTYRQWWFFAFAGDKWNASQRLTLDYGIRWELYPPATARKDGQFSNYDPSTNQLVIAGIGGNPNNLGVKTRYSYFAPRTGFAYRADDKTVIRGGFGMSYAPFEDNTYAYNYPVRANNAYTQSTLQNNYGPAVLANNTTPATFQAGFPAPVPVSVPSNGIIQITPGSTLNASTFTYIPKTFKNPYVESYNLFVQRALPGDFSLAVGYVGNHGVNLGAAQNINLSNRLGGGNADLPLNIAFGRTAGVNQYFIGTSTNYNSLQVSLNRRFVKGLSNTTAFTWGKGMGLFNGDDGGVLFYQDLQRNYGPMDYDRKFNLQEAFTYQLPFGKGQHWANHGFAAQVIGGWKFSAVVSLYSGTPFTVTANNNINTPGWQQTANQVAPFKKLGGGPGHLWFDPASFAQPAVGCSTAANCNPSDSTRIGNSRRNAYRGPGYIQNNASIFKTFSIREPFTFDLRMDVFQLSNTPQFASPTTSTGTSPQALVGGSTFGQITNTIGSGSGVNGIGGGRTLQLAGVIRF